MTYVDYILKTASPLQIFKATRIPVPTVKMFRAGIATPGASSLRKLRNLYRKTMYNQLRMVGFTPAEARKYRDHSPDFINKVQEHYSKIVAHISELTGVDPTIIAHNIAHSTRTLKELDRSPRALEEKMGLV